MKKGYLKYSDERNKRFSIKTEIDIHKKEVRKYPIYDEGTEHIDNICRAQELLKKYYSNVEICKVWKEGKALVFEFVEGESLLDKYKNCLVEQNTTAYEELLQLHKTIILGSAENACTFESSANFKEWFGEDSNYIGTKGLRYSNFDAIASNIIMRNGEPVFIDYEWTLDFVMPVDLVVYHCVNDMYLHNSEYEKFYPLSDAMKLLGVQTELFILEASYKAFFEHVICDEDGRSYAKNKYTCLKNVQTIEFILKEWEKCADNWQAAVKANACKDEEIETIRKEWNQCAENWKAAIESNAAKDEEIETVRKEWSQCAENWKASVEANEELQRRYNELERVYNEVINSKVWQANLKVRKVFGK